MSLIAVNKVTLEFGGQRVLDDISFTIEHNTQLGLVGKNGCGKTSLFNILIGVQAVKEGQISRAKNLRISYVKQEATLHREKTLFESVYEAHPELIGLFNRLHYLQEQLNETTSAELMPKIDTLHDQIYAQNGYAYENNVKNILSSLKFKESDWERKLQGFSGGEQTRIQLACALLRDFDVLLLDEPTNHLDFSMIIWLEKYLQDLAKPFVVISHDRDFLDRTVKTVIELTNGKIEKYGGNYSFYLQEKAERDLRQQKLYLEQQKFIEKTEDFIRRNMAGQKVGQAKSRLKMLEKMEKIEAPRNDRKLKVSMQTQARSGNNVLFTENLAFGFTDKILAKDVNIRLHYRDKAALIGLNGCGKTSFLALLDEKIKPLAGIIRLGVSLSIGFYDQLHLVLDENLTVLETIWQLMPGEPQNIPLGWLGRFGFSGEATEKLVGVLSGGERARLYLAKLLWQKPNFLILDEPTNHLDLATIASLEEALLDYDGTLLFVSHDRRFIKNVANRYLLFRNNGIEEQEKDLEEIFAGFLEKPSKTTKQSEKQIKEKVKRTNPLIIEKLLAEIENLHNLIHEKEKLLTTYQARFSDPLFYEREENIRETQALIAAAEAEIKKLQTQEAEKEEKYFNLSE